MGRSGVGLPKGGQYRGLTEQQSAPDLEFLGRRHQRHPSGGRGMISRLVPLDQTTVEAFEPVEGTSSQRFSISPFAVPHSATVQTMEAGLVSNITFTYLGDDSSKEVRQTVALDKKTDPE